MTCHASSCRPYAIGEAESHEEQQRYEGEEIERADEMESSAQAAVCHRPGRRRHGVLKEKFEVAGKKAVEEESMA